MCAYIYSRAADALEDQLKNGIWETERKKIAVEEEGHAAISQTQTNARAVQKNIVMREVRLFAMLLTRVNWVPSTFSLQRS